MGLAAWGKKQGNDDFEELMWIPKWFRHDRQIERKQKVVRKCD